MSAAFSSVLLFNSLRVVCLLVPGSAAFSNVSLGICPGVVYPGLLMSAAFSSFICKFNNSSAGILACELIINKLRKSVICFEKWRTYAIFADDKTTKKRAL